MKRYIKILTLIPALVFAWLGCAAKSPNLPPPYAWRIIEPLGLREPAPVDTVPDGYAQRSVPSLMSDAWACTGNLGGEGRNSIWSERRATSDFFFRDAVQSWIPSESTTLFYNSHIPVTFLSYNTGGSRDNAQDRLTGVFSGNINAKAQIDAMLDYLYSKGSYTNQAAKNLSWGASGSYLGDRYEFQGYFYHYNLLNKENGGITDPLYITDPAVVQGGVTKVDPKTIPVRLQNAHTRVKGGQFLMNHRYKVGYWHEEELAEGDTVPRRTYIPVTSFVWTMKYTQGAHMFSDDRKEDLTSFFANTYLTPDATHEYTKYNSLQNTLGVSLLEGFNKWAKFGLAAFATYEMNRYTQVADTLDREGLQLTPFPEGIGTIAPKATEHLFRVGGQLTKQRGSRLTYAATADFGITGRIAGDIRLRGDVATRWPLLGDTLSVHAFGSFNNVAAPYLLNNFISNHFMWKNDFGKTRDVRFGGDIYVGRSGTIIGAEVCNIQNHLYFSSDYVPVQHGGSVQIFSARLQQNLHAGILHWDNRITYQTSSDDRIISLPALAVYSNLYLRFKLATLTVQLGVDCDYYTRYYAPRYQPATATFANQHDTLIGNYPFMNAYANMKLSRCRFYVMMSHVNQGWFSSNYFSMPDYPLNPRRFQIGLSVDFAN